MHENIAFILEIYKSSHSAEQIFEIFNKFVVEIVPFGGHYNTPLCDYYKVKGHYTEESTIRQLFEDNNIGKNRYRMQFDDEKYDVRKDDINKEVEKLKKLSQKDLLFHMSKDINSFMGKLQLYKKTYNKTYNEELNNIDLIEARNINNTIKILNKTFDKLFFHQNIITFQEIQSKGYVCDYTKYEEEILIHNYRKRKLLFDHFYDFFTSDLNGKFLSLITENNAVSFI
jgi:hypothetical protein